MIPFPVEGWHVVTVDQSVAAAATHRPCHRYPTVPASGVRVMVSAHGERYTRFIEASRACDDAAMEAMTICVAGYGKTFEDAMADAVAQARTVNTEDPIVS
ncbi:hypothetical protein AAY80_245 [Stenotrophomonas phage vB_SmaS-DLP_6]|nr:hypothetical protein AAY80_245 [Stenotrophomonas phage vB_SmaS-DLP_6]